MISDVSLLDNTPPKTVHVFEPCECRAAKWWDCRCALVATYDVQTFDTVPDARQLAWIRATHPGKVLVY